MILFVILILLFCSLTAFFIMYPKEKRSILSKNYYKYCDKKVNSVASSNKFKAVNHATLNDYFNEPTEVDHLIFGNKFIYLISDHLLMGDVDGVASDNSWLYKKRGEKSCTYIANLYEECEKKVSDFATKINIDKETIIGVSLIPNECNVFIKGNNKSKTIIARYSDLKGIIKQFEKNKIASFNEEQILEYYNLVRAKNE